MQAKLLRVLEERTFERLGGTETLRMDARVMALTNAISTKAVATGRFREDLFLPAERAGDLSAAAARAPLPTSLLWPRIFSRGSAPVHGQADASLDPSALALLKSYAWPGNVRELKNAIEHALVFAKEPVLRVEDFPEILRAAANSHGPAASLRSLEDLEREAIRATLEATHYKIGQAAEFLGISRKTLLEKRKKYGLM